MNIQQLPITVANQIAAGEVIERPASVVKELLENALDAGASVIHIDIGHGGLTQIKISDDGAGILASDLPLAIAPHATSKIRTLEDLYAITTMGFRGEALASIASISRLTISSKPMNQPDAMRLITHGESFQIEPCARTQGTTVDVSDIFFNAPVRKKFLKSERLEFQAIEMVVKRFALSAYPISIRLSHNNKLVLDLPSAHDKKSQTHRIQKILGKVFIEQSVCLDIEHLGITLHGRVSTEGLQRSQNDKLWVYLNSRIVKDKLLNHAIKQAYDGLLHPGRYPTCLLYLTLPSAEVDVNVHPTKHEVRFEQPRLIHDFLSIQIQHALQTSTSTHDNLSVLTQPPLDQKRFDDYVSHHVQKPLKEQAITKETYPISSHNWLTLNEHFAIVTRHNQPYLIDVVALQQVWLKTILLNRPAPLPYRPILVPITHEIRSFNSSEFDVYQQQLNQVGIEISLISEHTILIRSLPSSVPHLNIKHFLDAIFKKTLPLDYMELIELLVTHQDIDSQNILDEEKEALLAFLYGHEFKTAQCQWAKCLSHVFCRSLFHV